MKLHKESWLFPECRRELVPEARERAREISTLLTAIAEAPEALDCLKGTQRQVRYFLNRAKSIKLDMNDHDGLTRTVGCELAELNARDHAFMRRHREYWKKLPYDWIGTPKGTPYCATLHPKEIAVLEQIIGELDDEMFAIKHNVPDINEQIKVLRSKGLLPDKIANQFNLTPEGHRKIELDKGASALENLSTVPENDAGRL